MQSLYIYIYIYINIYVLRLDIHCVKLTKTRASSDEYQTATVNIVPSKLLRTRLAKPLVNLILEGWLHNSFCLFQGVNLTKYN